MRKEAIQVERVWTAIMKVCMNLLRRDVDVSKEIFRLGLVRTLINAVTTHDSDECCTSEIGSQIRFELRNIEDAIIIKTARELDFDYATKLSDELSHAWTGLKFVLPPMSVPQITKAEKGVRED